MKYMLMMNGTKKDMEGFGSLPPEDIQAHINFMMQVQRGPEGIAESWWTPRGWPGRSRPRSCAPAAAARRPSPTARFPEAKEFLAGYWLVECRGPERAIEIAARASAAPGRGGVPAEHPGRAARRWASAPNV